jgi:hypothetical protein
MFVATHRFEAEHDNEKSNRCSAGSVHSCNDENDTAEKIDEQHVSRLEGLENHQETSQETVECVQALGNGKKVG